MARRIKKNLTLYINDDKIEPVQVEYNGEFEPYELGAWELSLLQRDFEGFKTPEDFLTSRKAKLLQNISDTDKVNITVWLNNNGVDIAWFEFWPKKEIHWDLLV